MNNGTLDNGFLTKLDPTGATLLYSTYIGGTSTDSCAGDRRGCQPECLPHRGGKVPEFPGHAGNRDSDCWPIDRAGFRHSHRHDQKRHGSLIYSTLFGGTSANQGTAIAVDSNFNAYITGQTSSTDFPVTSSAFQSDAEGHGG